MIIAERPSRPSVALIGRPGSGKGTQARLVAAVGGWTVIGTGDLLRAEVARATPTGLAVGRYLDQGHLVPDRLVARTLCAALDHLEPSTTGLMFDGFPRTVRQALVLDELLGPRRLDLVIELDVASEVASMRLGERARGDDTIRAIAHRLDAYDHITVPMLDWYRRSGRVFRVDGGQSVAAVFKAVCGVLELDPRAAQAAPIPRLVET